jgi:hypothetical protein
MLQLQDGRSSLHEVQVLAPATAATHPYLSPDQHPDLLAEAVSTWSSCNNQLHVAFVT